MPVPAAVTLDLPDEAATGRLGECLADLARPGDVFALYGPLGIGKTALARAFVRRFAGETGDIPSPTFTLAQGYDGGAAMLWHFDLYRLERAEDALELGLEEAFADGVSLIEWPERLGPWLPPEHLAVTLMPGSSPTARRAELRGDAPWRQRLETLP